MEIFITGGSGFVGSYLCRRLLEQEHTVTVLTRTAERAHGLPKGVGLCLGDPSRPGPWQTEAARHQGFVNLAGASIFARWTGQYKEIILNSRISTTRNLVQALAQREATAPAPVLVSASAVGYYGFHADEELDEAGEAGGDFLANVCQQWEAEAARAQEFGVRVVRARFGIVLGKEGGALGQMLPLFRTGLGGPLGGGRQWFSWIHQADLADALAFCLENPELRGAVNCTSPNPVTNRDLARALGRVLHKPAFLPAPGLALKLALGEFGSVLLKGQRVLPRALTRAGFTFAFPDIDDALADLLGDIAASA